VDNGTINNLLALVSTIGLDAVTSSVSEAVYFAGGILGFAVN